MNSIDPKCNKKKETVLQILFRCLWSYLVHVHFGKKNKAKAENWSFENTKTFFVFFPSKNKGKETPYKKFGEIVTIVGVR